MKPKIFIDGAEGTTGLEIRERLASRTELDILEIPEALRKDRDERARLLNAADIAILCLPDAAAKESVALVTNSHTKILDASTAHRVDEDWCYGLPEIGLREKILTAQRVANCGCHATGFILAVQPLVAAGVLPRTAQLVATSLTGYSGGGKSLIAAYQTGDAAATLPVAPYALGFAHKHLPEMRKFGGLDNDPVFMPVVGNFHRGMIVSIFFRVSDFIRPLALVDVRDIYSAAFTNEPFIRIMPENEGLDNGFMSPLACNGTNRVELFVVGRVDGEQICVMARFDNLGKGASGAAIQNLNLMLGISETTGL